LAPEGQSDGDDDEANHNRREVGLRRLVALVDDREDEGDEERGPDHLVDERSERADQVLGGERREDRVGGDRVGLVDRAAAGLVARGPDPGNLSVVRLRLTDKRSAQLEALSDLPLSDLHLQELAHLAPTTHALWNALEHAGAAQASETRNPAARPRRRGAQTARG
jgi:hypothetical protein